MAETEKKEETRFEAIMRVTEEVYNIPPLSPEALERVKKYREQKLATRVPHTYKPESWSEMGEDEKEEYERLMRNSYGL